MYKGIIINAVLLGLAAQTASAQGQAAMALASTGAAAAQIAPATMKQILPLTAEEIAGLGSGVDLDSDKAADFRERAEMMFQAAKQPSYDTLKGWHMGRRLAGGYTRYYEPALLISEPMEGANSKSLDSLNIHIEGMSGFIEIRNDPSFFERFSKKVPAKFVRSLRTSLSENRHMWKTDGKEISSNTGVSCTAIRQFGDLLLVRSHLSTDPKKLVYSYSVFFKTIPTPPAAPVLPPGRPDPFDAKTLEEGLMLVPVTASKENTPYINKAFAETEKLYSE
ncbi:MAG TPA: hypothetical protein PLL10_09065, partial [Elusimicrobiales bacterium]|nr:hypothetical protein [Elusimicrobiales bacterium]